MGKHCPDARYLFCLLRTDCNIRIGFFTQNQLGIEHAGDLPVTGVLCLSPGLVIHILTDIALSHIFQIAFICIHYLPASSSALRRSSSIWSMTPKAADFL